MDIRERAEWLVSLVLGNCMMEQDWIISGERLKALRERMIEKTIKDLICRESMCHQSIAIKLPFAERVCRTLEGIVLLDDFVDSDMVYRFCHLARGECKNPHEDWLEEFRQVEAEVMRALASPAEKMKAEHD